MENEATIDKGNTMADTAMRAKLMPSTPSWYVMPRLGIHSARTSIWIPDTEKSSCRHNTKVRADGMRDTSRAKVLISRVLSFGKNAMRSAPANGMKSMAVNNIASSSYYQEYESGQQTQKQDEGIRPKHPRLRPPEQPTARDERAGDAVDRAVDDAVVKFSNEIPDLSRRPANPVDESVDDGAIKPSDDRGETDGALDEHGVVQVVDVVAPLQQVPHGIKHLNERAARDKVVLVNRQRQQQSGHPRRRRHAEYVQTELALIRFPMEDELTKGRRKKAGNRPKDCQNKQRIRHHHAAFSGLFIHRLVPGFAEKRHVRRPDGVKGRQRGRGDEHPKDGAVV